MTFKMIVYGGSESENFSDYEVSDAGDSSKGTYHSFHKLVNWTSPRVSHGAWS